MAYKIVLQFYLKFFYLIVESEPMNTANVILDQQLSHSYMGSIVEWCINFYSHSHSILLYSQPLFHVWVHQPLLYDFSSIDKDDLFYFVVDSEIIFWLSHRLYMCPNGFQNIHRNHLQVLTLRYSNLLIFCSCSFLKIEVLCWKLIEIKVFKFMGSS